MLLGILTFFLLRLGKRHPEALETIYGEAVYPAIRSVFSFATGWLPFPTLTLVVILTVILLYRTAFIPLRRNTWTWRSFIAGTLSTVGAIIFLFYTLWGFNYGRHSIAQRMTIDAVPLDSSALRAEFKVATDDLMSWVDTHDKEIRMRMSLLDPELETSLSAGLIPVLQQAGFPTSKTPRGRMIRPKGILLRFSTAGIYIPYTGEGHVDAGMLPQKITNMALDVDDDLGRQQRLFTIPFDG